MNDRKDTEIIRTMEQRGENALTALAQRYGAICLQIISDILPDARDREECVNDAYLRLWNTIPPTRPDSLRAYLFTIVRNLALAKYRAGTAEKRGGAMTDQSLDTPIPEAICTDDALDSCLIADSISRYLHTLPKKQRVVFVRRYYYGLPIAQIARLCGLSQSNVKIILSRIRQGLREQLEQEGFLL